MFSLHLWLYGAVSVRIRTSEVHETHGQCLARLLGENLEQVTRGRVADVDGLEVRILPDHDETGVVASFDGFVCPRLSRGGRAE